MAKRNIRRTYRGNYGGRNKSYRKRSKYSNLENFAYKMALVSRGRKNPESKISDSYNKGLETAEHKKKTMF